MKKLVEVLNECLNPLGFSLSKRNFFLYGDGVVVVINLQKSNYDNSHFLNIGVWINSIGGENKHPAENSCHVRFRADGFIDRNYPGANFGEQLNADILDLEKEKKLFDVTSKYLCPLIEKIRSINSLTQMYQEGNLTDAFIHRAARDFMSHR